MLRSMYSAISGMQSFETQLDVIGNNIANVDTAGFKAGAVNFADVLSQTTGGASAPSNATPSSMPLGRGGTNPEQIGLGVKVAGIDTIFTQGGQQTTGDPLNVEINGTGLFMVSPNGGATPPTVYYTRAGDFGIDKAGNLTAPNGMVVMGYDKNGMAAPSGSGTLVPMNINVLAQTAAPPVTLASSPNPQIGSDGTITVTDNAGAQQTIGQIQLALVTNPGGLTKVGDSLYQVSSNSGSPTIQAPGTGGAGNFTTGALEMSNVDLTQEFSNMIVAQRGFDANSKMIGTDNDILNDIVNLKNG